MFLYKFGYGSYEESNFCEVCHEQEFSDEEFETLIINSIIKVFEKVASGEIKDVVCSEEFGISYDDIHYHVLQELLNIGFKRVEYRSTWSCFGWASLIDKSSWEEDRGTKVDKIFQSIPKDLIEKVKLRVAYDQDEKDL